MEGQTLTSLDLIKAWEDHARKHHPATTPNEIIYHGSRTTAQHSSSAKATHCCACSWWATIKYNSQDDKTYINIGG